MAGERIVGMSRRQPTRHLLSVVGHQKMKENDIPINAPPLSSSDDEEGSSSRGNIETTTFKTRVKVGRATRSSKFGKPALTLEHDDIEDDDELAMGGPKAASVPAKKRRAIMDIESRQQSPPKRAKPEDESLRTYGIDNSFHRNSQNKKATIVYGKKSSQEGQTRKNQKVVAKEQSFRQPDPVSPSIDSPMKKFKTRAISPSDLDSPSPTKGFDSSLIDPSQQESPTKRPLSRKKSWRKTKETGVERNRSPDDAADESQAPRFKMPPGLDSSPTPLAETNDGGIFDLVGHDSPFSAAGSRSTSPPVSLEDPVCPLCGEPVAADDLASFRARSGLGFDAQMRFCALHKRRTAREAWEARRYPNIDWGGLEARMAGHADHLRAVLAGDAGNSHFRETLRAQPRKAKEETSLLPGYYGMRGLRSMSEWIVGRLGGLLRERAVTDPQIAARGYTAFVHSVLVPELAVRLIMEDMRCGAARAQDILYESMAMGELLNEDVADVVVTREDDGDEDVGDITVGSVDLTDL
jgi:hypothetical protein